ncbi:Stk1 family PASTA domain-containing Ser/Thr kinase [Viridibacillus sp. YIM B01967]|uniref:non-specific serine/threonine protein kinase n=1 Tax=Viridibacillus soli TaxID=2798301 RepID=A0ABS1H4U9_9BACL|nr:Stk1 family PASTA domain-containing Ser/Thr kinase [Viridibacillus soli]MBK3494435.1 Stk1 family PASTA domain-containing Ser/Thr kinase [Viridibacillus soli]
MLVGKRISGRYKVLGLIGGGGMSNVYLAHDMILDRDVAIKVLRYNFADEEELHRRFQREALSATSLTHPNIVSIYDVGEDGDMHYLVMEYVEGKTLKQYIQEFAPLSPVKCVTIMKQLTAAIAHAHQNQIVHRDIKPQNILMDHEDNVKITDFGIAMALTATSYTQTNSVLGTVHYLSPEQARGGTATKRSDIYALGIVLYELLTGELPFSGESAVSIALKHLQSETPSVRAIVPSIPQSLENVVLKTTAKDPLHRYSTVEELQDDLSSVLDDTRRQEPKFMPPVDHDETKAMPAITKAQMDQSANLEKTKALSAVDDHKKKEKKGDKKKSKKNKLLLLVGGVISFLLLFILVLFLFPSLFQEKKIEVPDITGQELAKAIELLGEKGFEIGGQTDQASEDVEEGHVIFTNPAAGKERKKGSEIDIIVSSGPKKMPFINYTGRDIEQVMKLLEKYEFKDIRTKTEYSDQAPGTILKQTPDEGEEVVPADTVVIFTVSEGVKQETISSLIGYDETALNRYAKSSGFHIHTKEIYSDAVAKGQVISHTPKAGEKANIGARINVVISKGPQEKPPKMNVQIFEIPYDPEEEGEEQEVRIYIQDRTRSIADVEQQFNISGPTKKRIELEIEEGQKAIYRVVRDDKTIIEKTVTFDSLQ